MASRARDVALDARNQAQAHPYAVGAVGAGMGLGYWLVTSAIRKRRRLVPREWDEPFDRSSRRNAVSNRRVGSSRRVSLGEPRATRLIPLGAAATAACLIWMNRA